MSIIQRLAKVRGIKRLVIDEKLLSRSLVINSDCCCRFQSSRKACTSLEMWNAEICYHPSTARRNKWTWKTSTNEILKNVFDTDDDLKHNLNGNPAEDPNTKNTNSVRFYIMFCYQLKFKCRAWILTSKIFQILSGYRQHR